MRKKIIDFILFIFFTINILNFIYSCRDSSYELITHGDNAFWASNKRVYKYCFSLKDSSLTLYWEDFKPVGFSGDLLEYLYGTKFIIRNDSLFEYTSPCPCDTIYDVPFEIIHLSKNHLVMRRSLVFDGELIKDSLNLHRLTKRKMKRIVEGSKKKLIIIDINWPRFKN